MNRCKLLIICTLYSFITLAQEDVKFDINELLKDGRFEEAKSTLVSRQEALAPGELSLLGEIEMRLGNLNSAEIHLEKALNSIEANKEIDQVLYAATLNRLALVLWNKGQDNEAYSFMVKAIDERSNNDLVKNETLAASFNDLGLITSRTNPQDALVHYQKALTIYEKEYGKLSEKVAQGLINSGIIFRQMKNYKEARESFQMAQEIISSLYPGKPHPTSAFIHSNLGQNYQAQQNYTSALSLYQDALEVYIKLYGKNHPEIANIHNLIGQCYLEQFDYEKALNSFQDALITNSPVFNKTEFDAYPHINDYYQPFTLLNTLLNKSRAFQQLHLNRTLKFRDLQEAMTAIEKCDSLIQDLRQSTNTESDKLAISEMANDIYIQAVNLSYLMGEKAFRKKAHYEKAFYYSEKGKAAVLQEAIANSHAKKYAGLPDEVQDEEQQLLIKINFLERNLAEKPGEKQEKEIRNELFDLKRRHEDFVRNIERLYPQYYKLKYLESFPILSQIQASLAPEEAIISYFPAESIGKIFIFMITESKYKIYERSVDDNFQRYITGFRNSIYFRDHEIFLMTSQYMGDLLLPKIPKKIKKLSIIPSGRLGVIPFEALLQRKPKENNYSSLPFLIRDYTINYGNSVSFLINEKERYNHESILVMAPIEFSYGNTKLPNLFGTEKECRQIGNTLTQNNYKVELLLNNRAQESTLKQEASNGYSIFHLATHGVINEDEPALSRIYFGSGDDDGRLYTGEIFNLSMKTDLVTLSACETGLGKLNKGEGILGFTRALLYAGANNIIVSLWTVNDNSTAELMTDFYSSLSGSKGIYSPGLREAKLQMIKSNEYSAPYYWAPFILIGK